jgi:hypothetical protein
MSEWTEWKGGECPVAYGTMVDVVHRDGDIIFNQPAGVGGGRPIGYAADWSIDEDSPEDGDIVAYRLSK